MAPAAKPSARPANEGGAGRAYGDPMTTTALTAPTAPTADDPRNLRDARAAYWAEHGFGADGGEALRWVPVEVLGLTLYLPNTDARRRAVRVHDLHHVVTGYRTDLTGEAEIAAWELATGCARMPAALVLNLLALAVGMLRAPRRMLAAWARGRRSANLYGVPYGDALLGRRTDEVRRELGLDRPAAPAGAADVAGLAITALLGGLLLALPLVLLVVLVVAVA